MGSPTSNEAEKKDWENEEQQLGLYVPYWLQFIRQLRRELNQPTSGGQTERS